MDLFAASDERQSIGDRLRDQNPVERISAANCLAARPNQKIGFRFTLVQSFSPRQISPRDVVPEFRKSPSDLGKLGIMQFFVRTGKLSLMGLPAISAIVRSSVRSHGAGRNYKFPGSFPETSNTSVTVVRNISPLPDCQPQFIVS